MHGTFLQRVILTMFFALCAAGVIEFYKNFIQRADYDINQAWKKDPGAAGH
jgi:hypothetical protein